MPTQWISRISIVVNIYPANLMIYLPAVTDKIGSWTNSMDFHAWLLEYIMSAKLGEYHALSMQKVPLEMLMSTGWIKIGISHWGNVFADVVSM